MKKETKDNGRKNTMKAKKSKDNNLDYECPNCGEWVGTNTYHMKKCPNCGKPINWNRDLKRDRNQ